MWFQRVWLPGVWLPMGVCHRMRAVWCSTHSHALLALLAAHMSCLLSRFLVQPPRPTTQPLGRLFSRSVDAGRIRSVTHAPFIVLGAPRAKQPQTNAFLACASFLYRQRGRYLGRQWQTCRYVELWGGGGGKSARRLSKSNFSRRRL